MHIGAAICIATALACYLFSWTPGAWGLGLVGMVFELAAWTQVAARQRQQNQNE